MNSEKNVKLLMAELHNLVISTAAAEFEHYIITLHTCLHNRTYRHLIFVTNEGLLMTAKHVEAVQ